MLRSTTKRAMMAKRSATEADRGASARVTPYARGLRAIGVAVPLAACAWSVGASAQSTMFDPSDTTLVPPSIPEGFDRGRNVGVREQERPDYAPLPVTIGSFNAFPKLEVGAGGTSNVYLSQANKKGDGFAYVDPTLALASDWSRHSLQFAGGGDFQRFFQQTPRDQTNWNASMSGRIDIADVFKIYAEGGGARRYESPYSGGTQAAIAVLSSYQTTYAALRGVYESGQVRAELAVNRTGLDFSSVRLTDGTGLSDSQRDRNRNVVRTSAQLEYAFTPSVSVYGQANYDDVSYDHTLLSGDPNRSSKGYRLIGGVNFDIASFMRGTIGAGYVRRDYDSALYKSVGGASVEAKIEYFPSDLTTLTMRLRRFLEDSSIASNIAFFDSSASLRVDHELLRNLLLAATAVYNKAHYLGLQQDRSSYQVYGEATYMASHRFGLKGTVFYGKQTVEGTLAGQPFNEVRGQLGVYYQP